MKSPSLNLTQHLCDVAISDWVLLCTDLTKTHVLVLRVYAAQNVLNWQFSTFVCGIIKFSNQIKELLQNKMHFLGKTALKKPSFKVKHDGLRITISAARSLPNSSCPNRWGVRFTVCSDPPGAGPCLALVIRADWQQCQSWHTDSSTIGACHF